MAQVEQVWRVQMRQTAGGAHKLDVREWSRMDADAIIARIETRKGKGQSIAYLERSLEAGPDDAGVYDVWTPNGFSFDVETKADCVAAIDVCKLAAGAIGARSKDAPETSSAGRGNGGSMTDLQAGISAAIDAGDLETARKLNGQLQALKAKAAERARTKAGPVTTVAPAAPAAPPVAPAPAPARNGATGDTTAAKLAAGLANVQARKAGARFGR